MSAVLVCPICERPLSREDATYRCPAGHSFDVAREGYVNLLRQPYPGDTREMLRARRAFLDAGHYRPLAEAVASRVVAHLAAIRPDAAALLDTGCGEGYYTAAVDGALRQRLPAARIDCYGLDVAKEAVRLAARRAPGATFVVGNVNDHLPFAGASLAVVLDVFAPRNPAEFARVLAPGGLLMVVIPGQGHLAEPRAALGLLEVEPDKERHVAAQLAAGFVLAEREALELSLRLSGADLANLVAMTPSARHVAPEAYDRARHMAGFAATASFVLLAFRRR